MASCRDSIYGGVVTALIGSSMVAGGAVVYKFTKPSASIVKTL